MWRSAAAALLIALPFAPARALEHGACRAQLAALCPNVLPGGGRIRECLREHAAELSPECRSRFRTTRTPPPTGRPDAPAVDHTALESCRPDLARFCRDQQPGGGRWLACLHQHDDGLSPPCRVALGVGPTTTTTTVRPAAP